MRLYRAGYIISHPDKKFNESNKTIHEDLFIEPVEGNYNIALSLIKENGYIHDADDIILNIDYNGKYNFTDESALALITSIRDDIKMKLRDNKINTILNETI